MTDLLDRLHCGPAHKPRRARGAGRPDSPEQLSRQSGATEWSVAQVLSHLGSGAEIALARLAPAVAGEAVPEIDNQSVWDRWNAMSPEEQASRVRRATTARLVRSARGP